MKRKRRKRGRWAGRKTRRLVRKLASVLVPLLLLMLVVVAAWTLKTGNKQKNQNETEHIEEFVPEQERPEKTEKPEASREQTEGNIRAEQARAEFLPDYDSYPLLNTTPIKALSMQVGGTEDEVRFTWMSPDSRPGQVTWYTVQTGDFVIYDAECFAASTDPGYYVNRVAIDNIQPGHSYVYRVGSDMGGWSPEYRYDVPESDGESMTFLVTADAQIGQAQLEESEVTQARWDAVVTRLRNYVPEAEFLFHVGDQVANYGSLEQYSAFLDHLALYQMPLAPVVGNHDVPNEDTVEELGHPQLPYFYEHFNVPNRSEQYGYSQFDKDGDYHFVRGDVLFIVLNSSTIQPTDIHEEYVRQVVAQYPDVKWKILVQHYPAYSGVAKHQEQLDGWIMASLAYMVEENDIDLVLAGHDHVYTRSYFVDGICKPIKKYDSASGATAVNPEGALYVTCSTASGCIYQEAVSEERLAFWGQPRVPVAIRVDVTDRELKLTAYLVDSWEVYDEYTIRKD